VRASLAHAAKHNFNIPHRPLSDGGFPHRNWNFKPVNVFHAAASVADKVMMGVQVRVVPGRFAFAWGLADQAGASKIAKTVIDSRARQPGIFPGESLKDLVRGRMNRFAGKKLQDVAPLRSPPQSGSPEILIQIAGYRFHIFRLNLNLDKVKY
jgi:hypothetical protein